MTNSDNTDSTTRHSSNTNHNHHHHFIDGIGDGKHHEYDLPNNNEFQQHAFIRKKGIEELKSNLHNTGSHDTTSTGEEHKTKRLKKEQHLKQQSQLEEENPVAVNDKSDSSSSLLNDNVDPKGPLHQEQPNHHHNQRHHLPNHDHNNPNPNPSPIVVGSIEYQIQNNEQHKFFFSSTTGGGVTSSSFLITVFTLIGFFIAMNYIFNIFLGKNKSTGNRFTTHLSKLNTIHYRPKKLSVYNKKNTIAPSSPTTIKQSKSSIINVDSCIHNNTNNNCNTNKTVSLKQSSSLLLHTGIGTHKQPLSLFARIKYKLFHPIIDISGNHHEHVKTTTNKKKTDEWNEDDDDMDIIPNHHHNDNDEEDSSSSYNENNIKDGYYCYPQQDIRNTTRLRKPLDVGLQSTSSSVIQNTSNAVENVGLEIEYGEYGEFGVGLDGFDTTLQQQHVNVISESNYSHSRRVMNNNTTLYGGTGGPGPTGVPMMGSIDYNNRDVCSTSTIDSTSEDDEWDQISTRSSQSHDISLSSSSRMSSNHIPVPNPNNNTTYITTTTTTLPPSPMQSPLQTNKRIYVPSPTFENNSFFDSPTCSINDDDHNNNNKNHNSEIHHVDLPMPPEDEEMPTPRIDNYDSSATTRPKRLFTPSATSYSSYKIPDLPSLVSNLDDDKVIDPKITNDMTTTTTTADDPFTTKSPAPRSISVEELKLIRMETGMVERGLLPKWESKVDPQDSKPQLNTLVSSPEQCNIIPSSKHNSNNRDIMQSESTIQCDNEHNMNINNNNNNDDDDDDEKSFSGETEGANGIFHKRKNLTSCSDAASSLTSPIAFTELKMKELIGGGGFGQVWSATWRGTPVAVKVLAVSHKAEHIQKAIIQEFAAEINMVSGMRHPNICLYIGACLEPSNRAIITGKHDHFFLWPMSSKWINNY